MPTFNGTGGNDTLSGTGTSDTLNGFDGSDSLSGGNGNDVLNGGAGNDTLLGESGTDVLNGGADNDLLQGSAANDTLSGGTGDDTLQGGTGADAMAGGDGTDTLSYEGPGSGVSADLQSGAYSGGDAAGDTVSEVENITGSSFADTLAGDGGANILSGGDGADVIDGRNGDDLLLGGAGNDALGGGTGADSLQGDEGADRLFGGSGNDTLSGGAGDDTLAGDSDRAATWAYRFYDRDFTSANGQAFTIESGTLRAEGTTTDFNLRSIAAAARGTSPTANPEDFGVILTSSYTAGAGGTYRFATTSDDGSTLRILDANGTPLTFTTQGGAVGSFLNNDYHQLATTRFGDVVLQAGQTYTIEIRVWENAGDEVLNATVTPPGGTLQNLVGNAGLGGAANTGDDLILGGDGNDSLLGEEGKDTLQGDAGADTLVGGAGDDRLLGGADADSLSGDAGDDTLLGGAGADTIAGGTGTDTLSYEGSGAAVSVNLQSNANTGGDAAGDSVSGVENITGSSFADSLVGDNGVNVLSGGDGADVLDGRGGDDLLQGGTGSDTLAGGLGTDTLQGDDGADQLYGGAGGDSLAGGAGDDTLYGDSDRPGTWTYRFYDRDFTSANGQAFTIESGTLRSEGTTNDFDLRTLAAVARGGTPATNPEDFGVILTSTYTAGAGGTYRFATTSDDGSTLRILDANGVPLSFTTQGGAVGTFLNNDYHQSATTRFGDVTLQAGQTYTIEIRTWENGGQEVLNATVTPPGGALQSLVGNPAIGSATNTGADLLQGGEGNDLLYGEGGADTLEGGAGADTLQGGAGTDTLVGGEGADQLSGGADEDVFILNLSADGFGDVIDGGEAGADIDRLDLTGAGPLRIAYDSNNPENGVVEFLDANRVVVGTLTFTNIETVVPCFTTGTQIMTADGPVPVERLAAGDRVLTRDAGFQPLRWVGRRNLAAAELAAQPALLPVRIAKGALGGGLPEREMLVSPQHRVLVAGPQAELCFGESEVLVPALHLVGRPGISRALRDAVCYFHLMFDRHEIVLSDGAWTESFQPGARTLAGMDDAARAELAALFPHLGTTAPFAAARRSLKAHEVRVLFAA